MRLIFGILLVTGLSLVPLAAFAETAYVTDTLQLGLHRAADTSDRAFRTLESGQEVEILSQDRYYAQVKLPDGTTGYVKAAYLVNDKPAVLIVQETQALIDTLTRELEKTKAQFAGPAATIGALEQQVAQQRVAISDAEARLAELRQQNERYVDRQAQYKYSLPLSWVAGATAVCLFAGFLAGLWWLDYRSRRRHGGMRIY